MNLEVLRNKLAAAQRTHDQLASDMEARINGLPDTASATEVDAVVSEFAPKLDNALADVNAAKRALDAIEASARAREANKHLLPSGDRISVVSEEKVYARNDPRRSFIGDLYAARHKGDEEARKRLARGTEEAIVDGAERGITFRDAEGRAMGSGSSAGGAFLPPIWLGDEWANYRRAKRVAAQLVRNAPLVAYGNSITIPKVTGGTTAAAQTADNAGLSNTDATTATITVPVCTIAGYVDLSRQVLERSQPGLDQIVLQDLLADLNKSLNSYVVNGSGASGQPEGILTNSSINTVTYTDASPTVAAAYPKLVNAAAQIVENVYEPATAWLMHPRRWAWFLAAVDSQNRPLVVPNVNGPWNAAGIMGSGFGQVANPNDALDNAIAPAGWLLGLPVYLDSTIPVTGGSGTNQDTVIAGAWETAILWEDSQGPRSFEFEGVSSATAAIRVQVFHYAAFTSERHPQAFTAVTGTGFSSPVF